MKTAVTEKGKGGKGRTRREGAGGGWNGGGISREKTEGGKRKEREKR